MNLASKLQFLAAGMYPAGKRYLRSCCGVHNRRKERFLDLGSVRRQPATYVNGDFGSFSESRIAGNLESTRKETTYERILVKDRFQCPCVGFVCILFGTLTSDKF